MYKPNIPENWRNLSDGFDFESYYIPIPQKSNWRRRLKILYVYVGKILNSIGKRTGYIISRLPKEGSITLVVSNNKNSISKIKKDIGLLMED